MTLLHTEKSMLYQQRDRPFYFFFLKNNDIIDHNCSLGAPNTTVERGKY